MIKRFKKLIKGSPLELPARSLLRCLGLLQPSEWALRAERDRKLTQLLLDNVLTSNSNCIDVGAHQGEFLTQFLQRAPCGRHSAFEPLPELAKTLSLSYPSVEVHACALSNRNGRATFYHALKAEAWSGLQKQHYPLDTDTVEIMVRLERLDDCISQVDTIHFIKIDVEGAEYEVLQGAEHIIWRCRPIILFEHARLHAKPYGTTPGMLFDLLANFDMCVWDLARNTQFSRQTFIDICEYSFASGYDRQSQTNFVALPHALGT